MKGQGIHHPFWCNSRMKASASDQISDIYVEKDKYRQEVKTDECLQTSMSRSQGEMHVLNISIRNTFRTAPRY